MVIKNVNLETVCGITSTLPENQHPEVAFSGKSNVGISSLINGLMNRKAYARVSQQPGKTQTINYYNVNDEIYIVDLPGYGFANVSQAVKQLKLNREGLNVAEGTPIVPYSAVTKQGRDEIWELIETYAMAPEEALNEDE